MRDSVSPEEKLLKLIRKEKKETSFPVQAAAFNSAPAPEALLSRAWTHNLCSFDCLRRLILLLFFGSCAFAVFAFLGPWVDLKSGRPNQGTGVQPDLKLKPLPPQKPVESYLSVARGNPLFRGLPAEESSLPVARDMNLDFIKNISLVGILSGENPQAVIEDKKVEKTYYVSRGQFIGDFQVEDIKEGKISLLYKGQKYELFL